ncbi:MAG TPA: hypothetical protein VLB29_06735 [Nocardioidaceae bacterium]|nr:hypothetical protein [Nocardioidaceae bacterium]
MTVRVLGALIVAVAVVVGLGLGLGMDGRSTPPGTTTIYFPTCPPTTLTWGGQQEQALYQGNSGGTWDLRGAVWHEKPYPIRSESWSKGCIKGGEVHGPVPDDATRDEWYDGEGDQDGPGGEGLRVTMTSSAGSWLFVQDMSVEDFEDAYDPNAAGSAARTYLDHVYARDIRDDCIENEQPVHSVYVNNSFFDGCFAAFAQRPTEAESARDGETPAVFTVENSLVYVEPQPLGDNYCDDDSAARGRCVASGEEWLGAYGIWKWSDMAARQVEVRNTIFRLDMPSYSSCQAQMWPDGTYENVTLVWAGAGDYRTAGECNNTLPDGVTLTTDLSVWDRAVSDWFRQ